MTNKRAPDAKHGASRTVERANVGGSISRPKKTLPASIGLHKGPVLKANGSTPAAGALQTLNDGKRTRSALGMGVKQDVKVDDYAAANGNNHMSTAQMEGNPPDAQNQQSDHHASAAAKKKPGKPAVPQQTVPAPSLVEQVVTALNAAAAGAPTRKGGAMAQRAQLHGKNE